MAGPGLIQGDGDVDGNDLDFDDDVFWMCVGGYVVKGGLPLSRITLKL